MIKIRKTQPTDIAILMDIFEQAKHIMRKDGNMLQWRGNYPSREIVIADIEQGNSYVCTDDTEEIIGTFAFIRGNDPTYTHIYEGKWVEDTLPYGVIHRLASTEHSKEWPMPACNGATNKYPTYVQIPTGTIISCNTY